MLGLSRNRKFRIHVSFMDAVHAFIKFVFSGYEILSLFSFLTFGLTCLLFVFVTREKKLTNSTAFYLPFYVLTSLSYL